MTRCFGQLHTGLIKDAAKQPFKMLGKFSLKISSENNFVYATG